MSDEDAKFPSDPLFDDNIPPLDQDINNEGKPEKLLEEENIEFKDDTEKAKTKIVTTTIRDTKSRFVFLAVCCLVLMGSYYCYDNPAPVQRQITSPVKTGTHRAVEQGMGMSNFQYQLLYSFYSLPNIIIPLFGGYFIDRLGKRNGILVFASIVGVGQFLFTVSTHAVMSSEGFGHFLAIFGRFIFGIGGESLSVTESAFLAIWFKGKELSLAMGTDLCVSRIFTVINDVTQPAFYEASGYKLSLGFWFGFLLCVASLACALVLVHLDNKADKSSVQLEVTVTEAETLDNEDKEEDEFEEQVSFADLKSLGKVYWALTGSCVMTYMSFMSCMNVASDLLQMRFALHSETAGLVMSLPYLIAAVITPFVGYFIDLHGMKTITSTSLPNPSIVTSSAVIFALSHFYLAMLDQYYPNYEPSYRCIFGFVLFGISYSLYTTSIWPCVP
jgi:MFS family permease